jgi:glycosyltransferase involved in cell wall biosynthesis
MNKIKLSISIPYKQRLANISIVFEALANQTMKSSEFEVIIGAMEYSEEYLALCQKFTNRINIISVLSADEFSIPRARNLAMKQASGSVVVQMDADTLLPPTALQNLYDKHFAFGQNICVVGQVVGYGNNTDGDVEDVKTQPYKKYKDAFTELENSKENPRDPRFQVDHIIPWAFGWTGLIALPLATVHKHGLYFDEDFKGWGVEDLEWSYRICKNTIPIVLCKDVYAIHLPHKRNSAAYHKMGLENFRRFLRKWPYLDVELVCAFNDIKANELFLYFINDMRKVCGKEGNILGIIHGPKQGKDVLVVGTILNEEYQVIDSSIKNFFDDWSRVEVLPLVGMALPYLDKEVHECFILPPVTQLLDKFGEIIKEEIKRISNKVNFLI